MTKLIEQLKRGALALSTVGAGVAVTDAFAYVSRTGCSVAVRLYGPADPRGAALPLRRYKVVYLPLDDVREMTSGVQLRNAAMHKARAWIAFERIEYWWGLVVVACRPHRAKHKAKLDAIARVARQHYGSHYWRHPEGRELLRRELGLLGIKCPPDNVAMHYLAIKEETT